MCNSPADLKQNRAAVLPWTSHYISKAMHGHSHSAHPSALSQTSMWQCKSVSANIVPQCPKPSASQGESHPPLAHCHWEAFWPLPGISTSLPPSLQTLPLAKKMCQLGSEAPESAPFTTRLHLESGLAVCPDSFASSFNNFPVFCSCIIMSSHIHLMQNSFWITEMTNVLCF